MAHNKLDLCASVKIESDDLGRGLRYWDVYRQAWAEVWEGETLHPDIWSSIPDVDRDYLCSICVD